MSLSTVSASHPKSAPRRRTKRTGAAGAVNSVMCVGAGARAQRYVALVKLITERILSNANFVFVACNTFESNRLKSVYSCIIYAQE